MKRLFLKSPFYLFCLALSCNNLANVPSLEEKIEVFEAARFDKEIFSDLKKYEEMKFFLEDYLDTIISYRNSNNLVINVTDKNQIDTTITFSPCHEIFANNRKYDASNLPTFLQDSLNKAWNQIGQECSFKICLDSSIIIKVKEEKKGNGLYLSHQLVWNQENYLSHRGFHSDTLLTGGCKYHIVLFENTGW